MRSLLTLLVRLFGAAGVFLGTMALAMSVDGGPAAQAAPLLSLFAGVSFFLAPYLESVVWVSHGLRTRESPSLAFRVLGVVLEVVALGCIFWGS